MTLGGIGVILAIALIAFYLLYVVAPLFYPARIIQRSAYTVPGDSSPTVYLAMEEQRQIGLRISAAGGMVVFDTRNGTPIRTVSSAGDLDAEVTAFGSGDPAKHTFAFGLSDGRALIARHEYQVSYPGDRRVITPEIVFPFGEEPVVIDSRGMALRDLVVQADDDEATIVALTGDGRVLLVNLEVQRALIGGAGEVRRTETVLFVEDAASDLLMDGDRRELYVIHEQGRIDFYHITDKEKPRLVQRVNAAVPGTTITSASFLAGGISLLVGDSRGRVTQWFPVRDRENNFTLQS